jgi:hypothetical protein
MEKPMSFDVDDSFVKVFESELDRLREAIAVELARTTGAVTPEPMRSEVANAAMVYMSLCNMNDTPQGKLVGLHLLDVIERLVDNGVLFQTQPAVPLVAKLASVSKRVH